MRAAGSTAPGEPISEHGGSQLDPEQPNWRVTPDCGAKWSFYLPVVTPQQISVRLKRPCPDDESMRGSHETICQALFVQGRGSLRKELTACLRTGHARATVHSGRCCTGAWRRISVSGSSTRQRITS